MGSKSGKRFTYKIIASYLTLGVLAMVAAIFVYFEFNNYYTYQNKATDNEKLLRTSTLLTNIYEAENLSKLALQTKKRKDLKAYALKVDSIGIVIDTLKIFIANQAQLQQLDSIQNLLKQKVFNYSELRRLKVKNENNTPIDSLLQHMNDMEADLGRITPESLVPNFDSLTPEAKKSISAYAAFLNKNIPKDSKGIDNGSEIDSIFHRSKNLIANAKEAHTQMERSMIAKELQIYRSDLAITQKLRNMMVRFEQEITLNNELDIYQKDQVLKRSIVLTFIAVALGLIVVSFFTFLITKDFWKVQRYRQQLEKEKKYSESLLKSREQLIATVSHDLKTPLQTIDGYGELLQDSELNSQQLNYVKPIRSATKYISNLVNDLLDFSKLEVGDIHLEKEPFILSDLIEETTTYIEKTSGKKTVKLELDIAHKLNSPILGDSFRIQQILSNLIGNAFKFTAKGHVKITANVEETNDGYTLKIAVSDTGIGIKKEKQEAIFQKFVQADTQIEKEYGGHGLGLTISKKLTELLKGKLSITSKENVGSTFILELPLVFAQNTVLETLHKNHSKEGVSVLIFDDDNTLLQLLKQLCQNNGIKVTAFSSFEMLKEEEHLEYDLVLTDIQMPIINGFQVVKILKSKSYAHYNGQPIIGMTGQRNININRYIKAGFTDMLQKPFSQTNLLHMFEKVLNKHVESKNTPPSIPGGLSSGSDLFSLAYIAAFLETPEAIQKILKTFVQHTSENIEMLSTAVKAYNINDIQQVSHRMLPMFRQLKVEKVVPILEHFQHISKDISKNELHRSFKNLSNMVSESQDAIRNYLATPLVDSD